MSPPTMRADHDADSEKVKAFLPLGIHAVSIAPSPTAHVYTTLDTVSQADDKGVLDGIYGKDVMVWGGNSELKSDAFVTKLTEHQRTTS